MYSLIVSRLLTPDYHKNINKQFLFTNLGRVFICFMTTTSYISSQILSLSVVLISLFKLFGII